MRLAPPPRPDAETDVLAAMAQLSEHWQRCIADVVMRIAEELNEPGPDPRAGRHRRPADDIAPSSVTLELAVHGSRTAEPAQQSGDRT